MLMAIVPCVDGVSHSFWIAHLEVLKNKTKQPTLISTSFAVCSYSEKNQKPNNKKKNQNVRTGAWVEISVHLALVEG
jgi:hypothetical protein